MSDRVSTSIRLFQAQSARISGRVRARAAEAIRQETITKGFRIFYDWQRERIETLWQRDPKNLRGRANWDKFRALAIPFVRHFLSYERKGIYKWHDLRQRIYKWPKKYRNDTLTHYTRFTDYRWHPSVPFKDRYDRFVFFFLEVYKRGPPYAYDWFAKGIRIALFPGIRWNRPTTLVGSYLTEDGRVVSNRQAASWARMESAIRRMWLRQGPMDLV